MTLYFKCLEEQFKSIDLFFAQQEFITKPYYNKIILTTESNEYYYSIKSNNDYYYIVTD